MQPEEALCDADVLEYELSFERGASSPGKSDRFPTSIILQHHVNNHRITLGTDSAVSHACWSNLLSRTAKSVIQRTSSPDVSDSSNSLSAYLRLSTKPMCQASFAKTLQAYL